MSDEVEKLADAAYYLHDGEYTDLSLEELRALARDAAAVGARTALGQAHGACQDCGGYGWVRIAIDDAVPCENGIHADLDKMAEAYTTDEETTT